jgi:hypothetical protein
MEEKENYYLAVIRKLGYDRKFIFTVSIRAVEDNLRLLIRDVLLFHRTWV